MSHITVSLEIPLMALIDAIVKLAPEEKRRLWQVLVEQKDVYRGKL